jgi:signal transduction histidine kinase
MMDRGFILPNPGGKPEHLIGVMQDITERKRAEKQQLELALERERSETFRTLVGNIAHDIKTPLSTINTSLYLMQHYTDTQNYPQRIETIKDQVRVLSSFVQDLMTMARLEGEPDFHPITLNLTEMIVTVEMEFHPLIEQKSIHFTLNVDEQLPLLRLDQAAIRRMVTNLIENAINYTPKHGSINVQTRQQGSNVVLEVMDTGIGIAEADLPHIFERFYRSDQARTAVNTGSGLGLAIVKRVVEMHGGDIEVESRPGEGTNFRVFLPVQ